MFRPLVVVGLVGILAFVARPWSAATAPTPEEKPDNSLAGRLAKTIDFAGEEDPKTNLAEVLDKFSQRYNLTFEINEAAFKAENVQDALKSEIANPSIRPMKGARFANVLRKILSRVPSQSGATFLVRRDHVEITTNEALSAEIYGAGYQGPRLPLVNATINKRSLDDAVKQLADQAEYNVLFDNRAGEKAATIVSGKFTNAPLDTAVRLLADMADLRPVHLDNVLYVTTKENASALEARLDKERTREGSEETAGPRWRKGGGRGAMPTNAGAAAGM